MRKTIKDISARKGAPHLPLVCLTAYTAPTAKILDDHCDMILVGDSVAMVLYGEPSTLQADMEMMIRHGRAVVNATQNALVIVDMPFGSYQESKEQAFRNAARLLRETNATAVKLEGGAEMAETVAHLATRGVPVVGHVGLQPQSFNAQGGFKAQGRDEDSARKIANDAKTIADVGAFAVVIEGVPESLAAAITRTISCPTIGIGASASCDGQILVTEDMTGMTAGTKPKFVKVYADIASAMKKAVEMYAHEVQTRTFPSQQYVYGGAKAEAQTNAPLDGQAQTPKPEPQPSQPSSPQPSAQSVQQAASSLRMSMIEEKPATPLTPAPSRPVAQAQGSISISAKKPDGGGDDDTPPSRPFFDSVLRATRRS